MSIRNSISDLFASDPIKLGLEHRANLEQPTTSLNAPDAFNLVFNSDPNVSGEIVNERNSITLSTVYACVRVIAESLGTIPVQVKETLDKGSRVASEHSLAVLFNTQPNPDMSPSVFIETLAGCMALTGNGYAEVIRSKRGDVLELYPRNPLLVNPIRQENGTLAYELHISSTEKRIITAPNMIHVPLWGWDGLKGLSPVGVSRQTLGLTMAAQKHGARYFGNGSRPGGLLTPKSSLTVQQGQQMRDFWEQQAAGVNQGRIAILPSDWSYTALGMSLEDSQFLETRTFQRNEIAALFRVPSHMVGDSTRMSNSNHEQSSLSLVQDTLAPYLVKIEQELQRKLLPSTGSMLSRFQIKFDLTERLRTDLKTTLDSLAIGRQWGFYSANDGRQILGLNPIGPEGDIYLDPVNMLDAKKFAEWTPQAPPPPKGTETKAQAFIPLIRDSIGRLSARTQRGTETFTALFSPSLSTIAKAITVEARIAFSLSDDWQPATEKIISDCLKSIEHRSASWTDDHDATALDESNRIFKALRVNIYREAGATLALQDLPNAA